MISDERRKDVLKTVINLRNHRDKMSMRVYTEEEMTSLIEGLQKLAEESSYLDMNEVREIMSLFAEYRTCYYMLLGAVEFVRKSHEFYEQDRKALCSPVFDAIKSIAKD